MSAATHGDHDLDPRRGLRRFLVQGGAWAVAGRVAIVAVALGVHALVTRLLSPADVGRFFLLYSVVLVARTAGGLGVGRTIVRRLGQANAAAHPARARPVLETAFTVVAGGGLAVAVLLAATPVSGFFGTTFSTPLRWLAALWSLALVGEGLVAEAFRGLRRIGHAAAFNGVVSSSLLIVGLLTWHVATGSAEPPQLFHIVAVAALAASLAAVVGMARLARVVLTCAVLRSGTDAHVSGLRANSLRAKALLWPSLPILASTLIALVVEQLGLWLLGIWSDDASQLALFATGQRLARLVVMPLMVANAVLPPILARFDARGDRAALTATLRLSATVTFAAAALGTLGLTTIGSPLLGALFGPFYREAAPIVVLLAVGQLVAVGCGSCGVMLLMSGHQRAHLLVSLLTLGAMLAGGSLLRDSIDAWRMAWVVLFASGLQQLACVLAVRRNAGVWTLATLNPARVRADWQALATAERD